LALKINLFCGCNNTLILEIELHKSFQFTPTQDQLAVFQLLDSFLSNKTALQLFILRGYAGTGKTSILAHVAKFFEKDKKIVLLAPTGRAARVLSSYCGLPAFTVHKKIYRMAENVSGDMNFVLQKNNFTDTLFIVDEASMISSGYNGERDLLEDLMRFVYRGKGCKLIMSGDNAQLPPVDMSTSPALDEEFMLSRFNIPVTHFELNEVVRQSKESGILANATDLRKSLQSNSLSVQFNTEYSDFQSINGMELQESLEESISNYGADEVLIVTRSNKRANQFNAEIRNRLLFREDKIEAGDILMGVKNNYHWLAKEEKKDDFIANGESMEVLKVLSKQTMYGYEFTDLNIRFVDDRIPDVDIKVWVDCLDTEGSAMPQADVRDLFYKIMEDYVAQGESKKAKQLTLIDPFYNALQAKFSYAVTCHKAQGGQWSAVFIDHGYLTDEMVDESLLRWFYTAVTRATQKVYLVNFNEMFLG
jgi:exodeoxyribonuclease-5